jgi:uncharacterized membrane protein
MPDETALAARDDLKRKFNGSGLPASLPAEPNTRKAFSFDQPIRLEEMMRDKATLSAASIGRSPIHSLLVPFPIVCFVGTFIADLVYWRSQSFLWETFSVWLLAAGLIMAAFAVVAGLIDFAANRRVRELGWDWVQLLGYTTVIVLSLFNVFVHSRDGYTAVVPTGLTLSGIVVLLLIAMSLRARQWSIVGVFA